MSEAITSEVAESGGRTRGGFPKWFVLTSGAILATTGIAKGWTGLGNAKFLAAMDPIIGIKFGQLLLLVGIAEIAIACVCFFGKRQTLALGLVAWMSTNFVVYRFGLWWMDWKASLWVSRQPYRRPRYSAPSRRQHHESAACLPAHRQLRVADLAVAARQNGQG